MTLADTVELRHTAAPAIREDELAPEVGPLADLPSRIVFFDGVCSFCDGTVRWLRDHDPTGRLSFASLQGETAACFRRAFPNEFPKDIDTIVFAEREPDAALGDGAWRIERRGEAVIRVCEEIGGGWARVRVLRAVPTWVGDLAYRAFAANRYRMFGQLDACAIPTADEQKRLLP